MQCLTFCRVVLMCALAALASGCVALRPHDMQPTRLPQAVEVVSATQLAQMFDLPVEASADVPPKPLVVMLHLIFLIQVLHYLSQRPRFPFAQV